MRITGVVLLPLDQQHDRDGIRVDPRGVRFDPDGEYAVLEGFRSDRIVGRGKLSLGGLSEALIFDGELDGYSAKDLEPLRLSFSGFTSSFIDRAKERLWVSCYLTAVGLVSSHPDPAQPAIHIDDAGGQSPS